MKDFRLFRRQFLPAAICMSGAMLQAADVVKECNRLGILVDLAYASHATVSGALKVATQPLTISHTSLDSRTVGNPRMLEMMRPRRIGKGHEQACPGRRYNVVVAVGTKPRPTNRKFG
jgi:hypothetical protein